MKSCSNTALLWLAVSAFKPIVIGWREFKRRGAISTRSSLSAVSTTRIKDGGKVGGKTLPDFVKSPGDFPYNSLQDVSILTIQIFFMSRSLLEKVIRLCETRGFSMESCVGTTYTYQFGPLGTELRRNLRNSWWCDVVQSKANIYGFETTGEIIHTLNGQNGSSARSYVGNEHDKGNVISDLGKTEKPTISTEWTSESANILTSLVRFIPGIQKPFGIARNRKYFGNPEKDKYIFRYAIY